MRNQGHYKPNMHDRRPVQGDLFYAAFCFSDNRVESAQECIDAVNNAGDKEKIKPCMDWFLMGEKEGNILSGKSHILLRLKVHDKAADDEQTCNREPNDDAEFL
ncbi:MAG: hypothetical protein HW406_2013 [Candidatus Brocadiaceae bacterium]|nr:hypothetical protein [Candidatus Brocadiaceae bacterium]